MAQRPTGVKTPHKSASPTRFRHKHLLAIGELDRSDVENLLSRAETFAPLLETKIKKLDTLRGRTLINLFFENSTRTQSSFELAGKRMGADVVNMSVKSSSVAKGETLIDTAALPGPEERARQAEAAAKALMAAGYMPIGMDHFALPESAFGRAAAAGQLHRNFQGYTTDQAEALLGFGASAIGMLREGYVQNAPEVRAWGDAIEAGRLATVRGVAIDDDDRLRRAVIERLMCDMAVDLDTVARRHGRPAQDWTAEIGMLRQLQADGLVEFDGRTVRVRSQGRALVRAVAAVFDRYLAEDDGAPKHAVAV